MQDMRSRKNEVLIIIIILIIILIIKVKTSNVLENNAREQSAFLHRHQLQLQKLFNPQQ